MFRGTAGDPLSPCTSQKSTPMAAASYSATQIVPVMLGWVPHRNPKRPAALKVTFPVASCEAIGLGLSPPSASRGCVEKSPEKVTSWPFLMTMHRSRRPDSEMSHVIDRGESE